MTTIFSLCGCRGKRHSLLNTLAIDEEMSRGIEPDEPSQENFPDGGLFDPDQTLPYMWGDYPGPTLPCMFDKPSAH